MSDLETSEPKKGAQAKTVILGLFAVIGFLASIVTIMSFFSQSSGARLEVDTYANRFRTPLYSGGALKQGEDARAIVEKLRDHDCDGQNQDKVLLEDYATASKNPKEYNCKLMIDIEFAARWNGENAGSFSRLFEYEIRNSGDGIARDIRIRASELNSLQYQRANGFVDIRKDHEGEFFHLPDLNPGETLSVLAWSNSSVSESPYWREESPPAITYAGARIKVQKNLPVPEGWYTIYDTVIKGSSPIFIGLLVVGLSVAVVLIIAFIISIGTAIYQGNPISSVFKAPPKEEAAGNS